ncbi:MAG: helix-turn-helix domain-containing protein [Thermoanaerobaculia bacterium]
MRSALEAHQWRRTEAAEALGMSRTTLWRKMREHGLLK